jgi:PAS domain S-box-containing protein
MKFPSLRVDLRIALIYAIFGGLWIALSDRLLAVFVTDIALLTRLQTYKGWIYVVFSAALVYFLVRRSLVVNERAEAALRESAERYHRTLDQMLEGAQIIGFDWRYLYVNNTVAAQGKQTPQALLGRTMMEMYPGIEDTELFVVLRRCMEERAVQRLENEFVFPDGSRGWFELSIQPVSEGIFILSIDITERKRAEAERERLLDTLEASLNEIYMFAVDTMKFEFVNSGALRNLGYSLEQMKEMTPLDLKPEFTEESFRKRIEPLVRGNMQKLVFETTHRRADLSLYPVEVHLQLVRRAEEPVFLAIILDVTERKRAGDALRKSEERYRTLFEASGDAIVLSSPEAKVILCNRKTAEMLSYDSPEEIAGRSVFDLIAPEHRQRAIEKTSTVLEQGHVEGFEFDLIKRDGSPLTVEANYVLIRDVDGAPQHLLSILRDVTERKQARQEIERQLDRMKSLRAIDLAILGTTDLQLALRTILDEISRHLGGDAVAIYLFNPHTLALEPAASIGFRRPDFGQVSIHLGEGVTGRAALERRTIVVAESAVEQTAIRFQPIAAAEGIQAVCSTPLIARGNLIGVLTVYLHEPFHAGQGWLEFFETLAGQAALAVDIGKSADDLQRTNLELALAYDTTIEGWSHALDLRDKETEGHTRRVMEMTIKLARAAGIGETELAHIRRGALLHDIGKMGVPDQILFKPAALTEAEWAVMRMHPVFAYNLLSPIFYLRPALDIPYCHHEKWDGTGYPRGLKGEEIPLVARLFAVADVWDALRSDRPYRRAWREEKVIEHIRSLSGTHFDPRAVDLFLKVLHEGADGQG